MNLDILAKRGELAWAPSPAACDLDIWHQYDVPLVGTFRVGDTTVLFTAIGDVDDTISVWAYVPLTPARSAAIAEQSFSDVRQMQCVVEDCFRDQEAVITIARDCRVIRYTRVDVEKVLEEAAVTALASIVRSYENESNPSPGARLRVRRAELAEATREYAPA